MTRLSTLSTLPRRQKTSQELKTILENDSATPCSVCGGSILSILHDGSIVCAECEPEKATGRQCAIPVILVTDSNGNGNGKIRMQDLRDARRQSEYGRWVDANSYTITTQPKPPTQRRAPASPGRGLGGGGGVGSGEATQTIRVILAAPRRGGDCPRDIPLEEWFESLMEA